MLGADLLDGVRVDIGDGKKRPLGEFANVSVKDGKDLVVTVYEEDVSPFPLVPVQTN
jgi:ribosome recycling factor